MTDTLINRLDAAIDKMAVIVANADNATLGALRHLDTANPSGAAFWTILNMAVDKDLRRSEGWENAWAVIMKGMAMMAPSQHVFGRLGAILAKAGYSEMRLNRLLETDASLMADAIERMTRFLASKRLGFNWKDVAGLLFFREPAVEKSRRAISRAYYATR